MRKATVPPSFVLYIEHLGADKPLQLAVTGHLVVEALLVELIQTKTPGSETPWSWTFAKKIDKCVEAGFIAAPRRDVYIRLNNIRNDFGHILGHRPEIRDFFEFARAMYALGYEFSDDRMHTDLAVATDAYGADLILTEILNELYAELTEALADAGGADRRGG